MDATPPPHYCEIASVSDFEKRKIASRYTNFYPTMSVKCSTNGHPPNISYYATAPSYIRGICAFKKLSVTPSISHHNMEIFQYAMLNAHNLCPPPTSAEYTSLYRVSIDEFASIYDAVLRNNSTKTLLVKNNYRLRSLFSARSWPATKGYVAILSNQGGYGKEYTVEITKYPFGIFEVSETTEAVR